MTLPVRTPVLIIGSGPAGYTAAIYAARAELKPVVVTGLQPGGQLTITTDVENYPGFADVVQGPWLMEQFAEQAGHMGARIEHDTITHIEKSDGAFVCRSDGGKVWHARSLIIATGAQARWLGIPGEETFRGFGVSACATCDGFFFKDKRVAVIGGGNTAVEEALYLTRHAQHVTLIHRRDQLRAEKVLQSRLLEHPNITPVWNTTVAAITGVENLPSVTGLTLRSTVDDREHEMAIDGVFVAIGHDPATALFQGLVAQDDEGYILTTAGGSATSEAGIFAAGDVCDKHYRQAITAAGMGCMAAMDAEKFLGAAP